MSSTDRRAIAASSKTEGGDVTSDVSEAPTNGVEDTDEAPSAEEVAEAPAAEEEAAAEPPAGEAGDEETPAEAPS
jgi:hypothetical protein